MSLADHHCPGCGVALRGAPRYPWRFCEACLARAVDGAGRPLRFGNAGPGGGLAWQYADSDTIFACVRVRCLIKGRPVLVSEARFGGVVAQPVNGMKEGGKHVLDLCGPDAGPGNCRIVSGPGRAGPAR